MAEWANIEDWRAGQPRERGIAARIEALIDAEEQRWFLWLPVMFGVGIALYFAAAREPSLTALWAIAVTVSIAHRFASVGAARLFATACLAIAAGAAAAATRTAIVQAPTLSAFTGPVVVEGWIERLEPRTSRGPRVTLRVTKLGTFSAADLPDRVRIRLRTAEPLLKPGDAIRLRANLGPPPTPTAPDDFDFGRFAFFGGLGGFGAALGATERIVLEHPPPPSMAWLAPIEALRQAIRERIVAALPGEVGEIATALITGERGGITEETNQAYRNSGLFHILSISGLHMVIMAGAVFYVLRFVLVLIPGLAERVRIKAWAAGGAMVGAFAYLLISGAAFATVRSFVMIAIMFTAVMLDRPALSLRNVALAALFILVAYPESLFDPGFQMSFAAVVGLVSAYEWIRLRREARDLGRDVPTGPIGRALRFLAEIVVSTVIASIVVSPFSIYHFHNTQLLALVANVVAIPVCNLIVMPAALGVLLAMPLGLEAIPLWVMGHGIDIMTAAARYVGSLPGAVAKVPAIPTLAFALMVGGGLWLLLWISRFRLLGVVPIVAGIALTPTLSRPDMLVGRDGLTLAVRMADGRLSALAVNGSAFDLSRWMELDGDARAVSEMADARAFTCDAVGCIAMVRGRRVAVSRSLASLRDDCASADVLVLRATSPRLCGEAGKPGQLIIDPAALSAQGTHALYLTTNGIKVTTVAEARGDRPWSSRPVRALDATERTAGFTALFERFRTPQD